MGEIEGKPFFLSNLLTHNSQRGGGEGAGIQAGSVCLKLT